MNLSDECLLKAFGRTPDSTHDEKFCGTWENVDLSKDAFPRLTGLNASKRIQSKFARDGKLLKSLRFTPLFTLKARRAVSTLLNKRKRKTPLVFGDTTDEKSPLSYQPEKDKPRTKHKKNTKTRIH